MNTKVLKTFLTICRVGSITKAAQLLYISQPALSRQIQDLEEELGCKLFDRSKRQLALTESGFLLQQRAQEILNLDERTKKELRENAGFLSGELRIGCVESSAVRFLADKFQAFRATYPQVQFELYSADGDDIRAGLDQDRLDLGILLEPVESAKYESISLPYADRWGIVVPKDSPEAKLEAVRVSHLTELSLLLPRRWILLDVVASWLGVEREKLQVRMVQNLATNSFEFVRRGFGAMLCVEGAYRIRPAEDVVFVPLAPERRTAHKLVRRRNRRLGEACEVFWMRAKEMLQSSEEETA